VALLNPIRVVVTAKKKRLDLMTNAIENLKAAQQRAMAGRPKIGGFRI
jgi:hypothetical protein